nr:RDD family protein [Armatimonadota bacterium]
HFAWAHQIVDFFEGVLQGFAAIVFFLILWGYFIWFEIAWNGQTPGKRQMGLRVVRDGGYPVGPFNVITRNLLRVIDGMPLLTLGLVIVGLADHSNVLGALGGLSILITLCFLLFSARYQRLGDFVAGTMVVKQRAPRVPTLEALAPPPRVLPEHLAPYALKDIGRQVYEMTVPEYRAVRHYLDRRWQLDPMTQQYAAMRLAIPLMERLGIRPPEGVMRVNYADFLEYLAVAFEQYRGVK